MIIGGLARNAAHVHHIYPLMHGGNNNIRNLIHVNEYNHALLHNNPLDYIEKYCFQAIDYLMFLYSYEHFQDIMESNGLFNIRKQEILTKILLEIITDEMLIFYEKLSQYDKLLTSQTY